MATSPVNVTRVHPGLYASVVATAREAEAAAAAAGLSPRLVELLKIRVSQVNGCAFCLRAHTEEALALGETTERLAGLPAWRDTAYFADVERAALDLAERVTTVASHEGLPASLEANAPLTEAQVSATVWVAIALNAFNRIAIASGYPVAPREGGRKAAAA